MEIRTPIRNKMHKDPYTREENSRGRKFFGIYITEPNLLLDLGDEIEDQKNFHVHKKEEIR
jgi:hypothetical protein